MSGLKLLKVSLPETKELYTFSQLFNSPSIIKGCEKVFGGFIANPPLEVSQTFVCGLQSKFYLPALSIWGFDVVFAQKKRIQSFLACKLCILSHYNHFLWRNFENATRITSWKNVIKTTLYNILESVQVRRFQFERMFQMNGGISLYYKQALYLVEMVDAGKSKWGYPLVKVILFPTKSCLFQRKIS